MDITPFIGDALRPLRATSGLSQVERDVRNPTVASLQRLSEALGITLDVIFIEARKLAGRTKQPERQASRQGAVIRSASGGNALGDFACAVGKKSA